MSSYPQPVSPIYPPVLQRPGSITAISIIGIVLSALGILCNGFGAIINATGVNLQMAATPTAAPTPELRFGGLIIALLSLVMWIWLLIGSVGSLGLKRWARPTMIFYAIAHLVVLVVVLVLTLTIVNPETQKVMKAQMQAMAQNNSGGPTPDMSGIMGTALVIGAFFWWLVLSILPIFIIVVYRKPNIIRAFERTASPAFIPIPQPPMGQWPGQ